MPRPKRIGYEFDFLASRERVIDDPPVKKACVITSVRNEGVSLLEWIAHYRIIGFDTIFVYSNDNTDASDDLLEALSDAGIIRLCWNAASPRVSPQIKAYRHAFWCEPEVAEHEWAAMLDADEFLVPCIDSQLVPEIGSWLQKIERRHSASAVSLNWKWFGGDGGFKKQVGLCAERFREAVPNEHVKTVFKLRDAVDTVNVHVPLLSKGKRQIGGDGRETPPYSAKLPPAYAYGQINHYWNKSFEEFYAKKKRGRGAVNRAAKQRDYAEFFNWGRGDTKAEPLPAEDFIARVKDEMTRLRALPRVAAAEERVHTRFRSMMDEDEGARRAYDETAQRLGRSVS